MKILQKGDEGTVYQIEEIFTSEDSRWSGPVVIDVVYSGGEDEEGNLILEFEWCSIEAETNPGLTVELIEEFTDSLECGREESIVRSLVNHYKKEGIPFSPNEYEWILNHTN
jgi:hypothetical protein